MKLLTKIKELFVPKPFVSPIDEFLLYLDKKFPKLSLSQRLDKEKYARIYRLRDNKAPDESKTELWDF